MGGGVRRVDCLFGLELLCLDCCMCDLYFDRHRSVSEDGVARGSSFLRVFCLLWSPPRPCGLLLVVFAVAISRAPCGVRRGHIDCPLWLPPRPCRLPLVVSAAAISIAPCGRRRGIVDGSLWFPPRYYRWLLVVAAAAISIAACNRRCGCMDGWSWSAL